MTNKFMAADFKVRIGEFSTNPHSDQDQDAKDKLDKDQFLSVKLHPKSIQKALLT